ncbi:MAG TPA: hypothetical protein VG754_09910 [Verrucomicrobiae bacterium]|nr:hypothetical protein [Verrucomicrobiae bacterium]
MLRLFLILSVVLLLNVSAQAVQPPPTSINHTPQGSVLKVLPQFLDQKGQSALTASLYDRDAYQAFLRKNPRKRSTLRFAVQWKAKVPESDPLSLRVEIIGAAKTDMPRQTSIETAVRQHHWFSHWTYLTMPKEQYKDVGDVTAWRVTLWDGDKMLSEQKSFLWQ